MVFLDVAAAESLEDTEIPGLSYTA